MISIETTKTNSDLIAENTLNRRNAITDFIDQWLTRDPEQIEYIQYLVLFEGYGISEMAEHLEAEIKEELEEQRTYNPLIDILVRNGLRQVNWTAIDRTYCNSFNC
jgi:hypothetical protein